MRLCRELHVFSCCLQIFVMEFMLFRWQYAHEREPADELKMQRFNSKGDGTDSIT